MPCLSLILHQTVLNNGLSSDTGVVIAWNKERRVALHTLPSDKTVLDSNGEGVTNVKVSSDIGRRESHGETALVEGCAVLVEPRLEEALLLPPVIVSGLDLGGVIAGGEVAGDI